MEFIGLFRLEETLDHLILLKNYLRAPIDSPIPPTFRIYSGADLIAVGNLTKADVGDVEDATNASPINIEAEGHGLETGNQVVIAGVGGNTAANGNYIATKVNANNFTLNGTTGNGAYTSGGTFHLAGLYLLSQELLSSLSFESGTTYEVIVNYSDGTKAYSDGYTFTVV